MPNVTEGSTLITNKRIQIVNDKNGTSPVNPCRHENQGHPHGTTQDRKTEARSTDLRLTSQDLSGRNENRMD